MAANRPHNPFLPADCQDEPFSDPFGDGTIERYATMPLMDDEPVEEPVFTDGCGNCWVASSFSTNYVVGNPRNKLCANCTKACTH